MALAHHRQKHRARAGNGRGFFFARLRLQLASAPHERSLRRRQPLFERAGVLRWLFAGLVATARN